MSALKGIMIFVLVVVVGAVLAGGCAYGGYKKTIAMDESVKSSWGDIDVQLKRRFDLIPNIVSTVKGYATHEKELFEHIADARSAYTGATSVNDKAQAASRLESALSRLLVIQEKYPDLKANENFRSLQVTLEGTENRISEMRKRYNDNVRELNAYIRAFPGSLYASWSGVKPATYFEAGEASREAPKVQF